MQKIKQFISKHPNYIAGFLLAVMAIVSVASMKGDSAIVDEIAHIPAGYSYLKYGDYRLNVEHPPLLKDLAGLPLQFINLKFPEKISAWTTEVNGQWESGWHFLYHIGNNADSVIFWARIPMVLTMLLLGFYVYKATKEWFGQNAALLALALYVFCPNIIAHGRFVTTDVGAATFIFISIYYFIKWLRSPALDKGGCVSTSEAGNIIKASIALALAQLAKFSAVLIIPLFVLVAGICFITKIIQKRRKYVETLQCNVSTLAAKYFGELLIIFISAFILIGLFYYPHVKNMPVDKIHAQIAVGLPSEKVAPVKNILDKMADIPLLRPHAYYLTGFAMVIGRVAGGNTTFFLGQVTNQSFKAYFPVVYLAKTPLATLILVAAAIAVGIMSLFFSPFLKGGRGDFSSSEHKKSDNHSKKWIATVTLLLFIFIYAYTSITGNLNIGFRHLMPILPPIFILVGYEITKITDHYKPAGYILAALLVWLIGVNVYIYPHYVAYFNEAAGGPSNGYKIVTDSNIDWGQDLKRLKEYVDDYNYCAIDRPKDPRCISKFGEYPDKPIKNIKIDYFGGGDPKYYFCQRKFDASEQLITDSNGYNCDGSAYQDWHANNGQTTGWIAVSATFLQNSLWYKQQFGEQDYEWLWDKKPEAMIGYSILVYNIR